MCVLRRRLLQEDGRTCIRKEGKKEREVAESQNWKQFPTNGAAAHSVEQVQVVKCATLPHRVIGGRREN